MAQLMKSIVVRVSPEFHKKLKTLLTDKGITFQEYVMELIKKDLDKNEGI